MTLDQGPLSEGKRKSDLGAVSSVIDPTSEVRLSDSEERLPIKRPHFVSCLTTAVITRAPLV
jgi:hypothetical protein